MLIFKNNFHKRFFNKSETYNETEFEKDLNYYISGLLSIVLNVSINLFISKVLL